MNLCELFSLLGSVRSEKAVDLRPNPDKMISAAVMKKVLFLLVNETTIAVYVMKERTEWSGRYYKTIDNRKNEINLQDLGLTTDCDFQKIWAGDTTSETYILHVLCQQGQNKILVSYNVNTKFLEKCEN